MNRPQSQPPRPPSDEDLPSTARRLTGEGVYVDLSDVIASKIPGSAHVMFRCFDQHVTLDTDARVVHVAWPYDVEYRRAAPLDYDRLCDMTSAMLAAVQELGQLPIREGKDDAGDIE